MLSSVEFKNKSHIFLSGRGVGGYPPEKNENQESRRSHLWSFLRTILPSVNEQFQRILLPFIVCSCLNIKFRYHICILSVLILGCRKHFLDLTLDNDIRKSGHLIQKSINPIDAIHKYLLTQLLQLVGCPT